MFAGTASTHRSRILIGIVAGGFLAGAFDIAYAFIWFGMKNLSPLWVLQSVATGIMGAGAFKAGWTSGALGLAAHLLITIVAAAIYFLASLQLRFLVTRPWLNGALFGVMVYLFMNFVVLPLSAIPFKMSYPPGALLQGFVSHAILVGMPIAWCIRWTGMKTEAR